MRYILQEDELPGERRRTQSLAKNYLEAVYGLGELFPIRTNFGGLKLWLLKLLFGLTKNFT